MFEEMFSSIMVFSGGRVSIGSVLICTAVSLVLGFVVALVYMYRNVYTKKFVVTLALLPAIVQAVIMLVNGNLGTGVAIVGAFSLVRFRSVPGSAKEISAVFFSMAIGLATGMGLAAYAVLFTAVISLMMIFYSLVNFGEKGPEEKVLKITIPENLDYTGLFDDLFDKYTRRVSFEKVRTTNLGSLFELQYTIVLRDISKEKEFIDEIRCRNGNLGIVCGRVLVNRDEM